jgi:hypothetical protein
VSNFSKYAKVWEDLLHKALSHMKATPAVLNEIPRDVKESWGIFTTSDFEEDVVRNFSSSDCDLYMYM